MTPRKSMAGANRRLRVTTEPPDDGAVITLVEAAQLLGVTTGTVERYNAQGRLPWYRPERGSHAQQFRRCDVVVMLWRRTDPTAARTRIRKGGR